MRAKYTTSIVLLILLISLILPLNSIAQREPKNRIPDDRLKTRLPSIDDKTKPRERPEEKEKIKEKNPPPPIKEKKPEQKHPIKPVRPIVEYPPKVGICIIEKPFYNIDDSYDPKPEFIKPNYKSDGIEKYKDGDYIGSLEDLNIAIEEDSNDTELYYYRGLVELKIQLFEEAKNDLTKYLEYFFYESDGYFQRGLAKFYLNEKDEAREDFQIAAEMDHKLAISILKRFY
jgi:tetratricopeptide (TPR) repeat protein